MNFYQKFQKTRSDFHKLFENDKGKDGESECINDGSLSSHFDLLSPQPAKGCQKNDIYYSGDMRYERQRVHRGPDISLSLAEQLPNNK